MQAILTKEFRVFEDEEQPDISSPVSAENNDNATEGNDLAVFTAALLKLRAEAGWSEEGKKASEELEAELKKKMNSKASAGD